MFLIQQLVHLKVRCFKKLYLCTYYITDLFLFYAVTQNNATVYNRSGQFLAISRFYIVHVYNDIATQTFNVFIYPTAPVFSPLPASTVYAIIGRRVNISCSPNETTAPVNWRIE